MKNCLNFNMDEIIIVQAALGTFLDSKEACVLGMTIKEPLKTQLIESALTKLEKLSLLTYFNKQELTIMIMSLEYIKNICEIPNEEVFLSALDKLFVKADASSTHLS